MDYKENEMVPMGFTKYFDRIICPYCDYGFILIATFRTSDELLEENPDYQKWFIMQQCRCDYCPNCGKKLI